jgi:transaldolase
VSLEVAPDLADDGAATEQAARTFHERIVRPNLMVKIPATAAGIKPIFTMISEGRNVNVTLIFGLERYADVIEAYITGLEALAQNPDADLSLVASVASFFVSRVDVEVDRRLDEIGGAGAEQLKGHAAIAQAKLAYQLFCREFSGERWDALAARGARPQRPLWASTSTKNADDAPTKYVDALIGPDTVTTLPEATLDAFNRDGVVARTVDDDIEFANEVWVELAAIGVDMDDVAVRLETEGVASFKDSFDALIHTLHTKATRSRQHQ